MPDQKSKYWKQFQEAFCRSIMDIDQVFFTVDQYDDDEEKDLKEEEKEIKAAWRERVYCYELYHQLRHHLPIGFPYTPHCEIDKKNHGNIQGMFEEYFRKFPDQNFNIKAPNPDFVVHKPGEMENGSNLVVVEVKHSKGYNKKGYKSDLLKLECFIEEVKYNSGIFLIYGPSDNMKDNVDGILRDKQKSLLRTVNSTSSTIKRLENTLVIYHPN